VFSQAHYLENFVQATFEAAGPVAGRTLVLGGDGRFHNDVAVQTILKVEAWCCCGLSWLT
jgi:phosphoglucomutase